MPSGRPSEYTPEKGQEICDWVAEGKSLRSYVFGGEDRPTFATIYRWLDSQPAFSTAFARAREVMAHADADRLNAVVEALEGRTLPPDVARVMADTLKWTAARRLPRAYGDRIALGGDDGAPLVVRWADGSE